jgi:5-formyltetrahydrofolate cyclo-ligase
MIPTSSEPVLNRGRMLKQKLRQLILARRRSLSALEAGASALIIQKAFIASAEFSRARTVGLYAPIQNEVDTTEVLIEALASSRTVLYPVVCGERLEFRRVLAPDRLCTGAFGIAEPDASCQVRDPQEADLIVVPGIAFDATGKRIGYGKGYYDKALHHLEGKGKLVGFCYDFQLVETIAGKPHDVTMDLLITDKRVIRPRD